MSKKIAIVIPTIRNLDFLRSWKAEFKNCIGIIIEDHPQKQIRTPIKFFKETYHYCWQDIDKELGRDSWIISRKNSGIRCFGFLKAWQKNVDVVITLDDDCYPISRGFIKQHLDNLSVKAPFKWQPSFPHPQYNFSRGFPYQIRDKYSVVMSHGLWSGALDLDGITEKRLGRPNLISYNLPLRQFISPGQFFPMCVMNLAFKKEIIPLMFMPLMGESIKGKKWGYDRFDDIWAGVIVKKILDHLDLAVISGSPFVEHRKKTSIDCCLKREKAGLKMNEKFWQRVDKIEIRSKKLKETYQELIGKIKLPKEFYFSKLKEAMKLWINLF